MTTRLLMTEREYLDTLANSNRFEFCNGVVTEKRGEFMTRRKHVTLATRLTVSLLAAESLVASRETCGRADMRS